MPERMLDPEGYEEPTQAVIPAFLRDPIGMLRRRWKWMAIALGIGTLAAIGFVAGMQPRFLASATIRVMGQEIPEEFVRSTIQDEPLARMNAMLGTILSQREIASLVEKYDLYAGDRDSMTLDETVVRTRQDIAIEENVSLVPRAQGENSQLYTVSFEADSPDLAAAVANEIAARITDESIRSRSRQATVITTFLQRELERAETKLREQNGKITEFKERHRGELPGELPANLAKLDRLQQQRQSLSLQIAEADSRLATLTTRSSTDGAIDDSPEAALEAHRQQLTDELALHTEAHPNVGALRKKIAALEAEIAGHAVNGGGTPSRLSLVEASRRTISELRTQLAETERDLKGLDIQVAGTPAREEGLEALVERESVLREEYLEFLRKVQDAQLAQSLESAQQGERISVVDAALAPSQPMRTRSKYLGAGVVAALAFALGVGLLLEIRDPVLVSADQLEALANVPLLGSVTRI